MKKKLFLFLVFFLLIISGCKDKESVTGKSVVKSDKEVSSDERINECARLCSDGIKSQEYFIRSCEQILRFGGEQVFNDYVNSCR